MICYLHIGLPKTATTTIQHFLDENRETLKEQGIGFTQSLGLKNDRALGVLAYGLNRRDDYTMRHQIYTNHDLQQHQKESFEKIHHEIKMLHVNRVLFSSEHLHLRLIEDSEREQLKKILEDLGFQKIIVILYLRHPAELVNSFYSTACKYDDATYLYPPEPQKGSRYEKLANHAQTLQNFEKVFGKENIVARLFDKKEFVNGSIIDDFCDAVGITLSNDFKMPPHKNSSLSLMGIEILRGLNQQLPRFREEQFNPLRRELVESIEKFFSADKSNIYRMPKSIYLKYNEYFEESNEWVRKHYFPSKESLFNITLEESYKENYQLDNLVEKDSLMNFIEYMHINKRDLEEKNKQLENKQNIINQKNRELEEKNIFSADILNKYSALKDSIEDICRISTLRHPMKKIK
ncbi:MAG: hypothetical protein JXQ76_10100, partial [Campylobacterales bacterium]|nr:hypothetical protein [Campylobacterales bacterium]